MCMILATGGIPYYNPFESPPPATRTREAALPLPVQLSPRLPLHLVVPVLWGASPLDTSHTKPYAVPSLPWSGLVLSSHPPPLTTKGDPFPRAPRTSLLSLLRAPEISNVPWSRERFHTMTISSMVGKGNEAGGLRGVGRGVGWLRGEGMVAGVAPRSRVSFREAESLSPGGAQLREAKPHLT